MSRLALDDQGQVVRGHASVGAAGVTIYEITVRAVSPGDRPALPGVPPFAYHVDRLTPRGRVVIEQSYQPYLSRGRAAAAGEEAARQDHQWRQRQEAGRR